MYKNAGEKTAIEKILHKRKNCYVDTCGKTAKMEIYLATYNKKTA